ncbi:DMT family transporter [Phenylobacterium montanum]|uniref:DMT family transporter n=1 Tax=Phenylobacterium montanum TaxID=2823693 RepID=A0A975G3P4_9CAUL|nr:DMT family transporter [Caulobacter sp. S6]QUD89992.1 DMT family transporter [Caulobacter sp. S6]
MLNFLWIPATVLASGFQVARNGLQRSLMPQTGPWGATLVRFLFGLPFSILFALVAQALAPAARPHLTPAFWQAAVTGALAQVLATAALLVAMRRAGFAVGTSLQQSSLPLAALIGLAVYHDHLSPLAWGGVAVTTAGLLVLTWPKGATGEQPLSGAAFGLLSGLFFGFSLNAFRHASLAMEPQHPIYSAVASVVVVQAMQALGLLIWLGLRDRKALAAVFRSWRQSLGAGLCGACASAGWFIALALSAAAPVRAVGVVEAPMAAIAGRRFFSERLHPRQIAAGGAVLIGVLLTTLN